MLEHTATWTSQRSRTSYEESYVPSGQGVKQGPVKRALRSVRRRIWMLNTSARYGRGGRNHSVAKMGDRRVGTNRNVALMGDRRVGTNDDVAIMGDRRVGTNDVAIMGDRRVGTNDNVAIMGDRRVGTNDDVAIMGDRRVGTNDDVVIVGDRRVGTNDDVAVMGDRRAGTNDDVAIMGDRRVGTNDNVAIMGDRRVGTNDDVVIVEDVVTISQKNEVKTEGTVCCVADETTHQNDYEVKAPQEFKETKSVSAAGLKPKTEHKVLDGDDNAADFCFLQSLVPDMKKLSDRKKLKFKALIISSMGQLMEED